MIRALWWAMALWLVSAVALAQGEPTKEQRDEASAHFRQGVELFREGAYRAALVELERANEIAPDYRVLFNIGQTQLALGEYVGAINAFEGYLVQGGSQVDAARRAEVEADLASLRKRVASLAIRVSRDGADVFVDSVLIGKAPLAATVPVSVGRHRVFAQTADGTTASQVVDVAGGDLKEVSLELAVPTVAQQSAAPVTQQAPAMSKRRKWTYGLLGGAVGLGAGAAIAGFMAASAHSDYQRSLDALPGSSQAISDNRDKMQLRSLVTDGLAVGAVLLGATALTLFLIGDDAASESPADTGVKVEVGLSPSGFLARGQF